MSYRYTDLCAIAANLQKLAVSSRFDKYFWHARVHEEFNVIVSFCLEKILQIMEKKYIVNKRFEYFVNDAARLTKNVSVVWL